MASESILWVKELGIVHQMEALFPFVKNHHNFEALANTVVSLVVVILFGFLAARKLRKKSPDLVPPDKLCLQNIGELLVGAFVNFLEETIGHGEGRKYVWLIGTLGVFILISNLSGLVPGFLPATENLNTTAACGLIIFFATHVIGVKKHGFGYIKQFLGPMKLLAPLMLPIELISHAARPLSLSLRLYGNIFGDHMVFAIALSLAPLLVPSGVMVLGLFVSLIQTLVFVLLATVYIAGAVSEGH